MYALLILSSNSVINYYDVPLLPPSPKQRQTRGGPQILRGGPQILELLSHIYFEFCGLETHCQSTINIQKNPFNLIVRAALACNPIIRVAGRSQLAYQTRMRRTCPPIIGRNNGNWWWRCVLREMSVRYTARSSYRLWACIDRSVVAISSYSKRRQ